MAMDPVGKEDKDVDNDGRETKTDKYLMARRRAIAKKMKEEAEKQLFMDPDDKMWDVSYDHGPHQSNTIKVKAKSQSHAWEVAKEVAKRKYGHARITSGSVTHVKEEAELDEGATAWDSESQTERPVKHFEIHNTKTKSKVGTAKTMKAARTAKDKHDSNYGSSVHSIRPVWEEVSLEEGDYDDMVAAFKAKGGKITRVDYKEPDEKQKAKLGASWTRGGGGKGGSSQASGEYASMNTADKKYNTKQASNLRKSMGVKEEIDNEHKN